ncbi:hypothetical protein GOV13_04020 [Candidatus Pacearchaeota archaeon]|nr:hypothetical protein [Candidatus Pacearchaeota archaeon]
MLDSKTIKKIGDFVYTKPRSIQEIANHIGKNWRTADRYIQQIEKEFGILATRIFRGGTRGALKIVYWASMEKVSSSIFQEKLEEEIKTARKKEDFSAFDIFQHIPDKNKKASIEKTSDESLTKLKELDNLLKATKKQLLIFSGNLSFINLKKGNVNIFKTIEELVKKGINIKVICRVDIIGKKNIEKLLSLNFKHGKENIEIRHREHPLRAFIVDNKFFRIKEIKEPTGKIKEPTGKIKELDKKIFIFYTIKDKEWSGWLSKIFWNLFNKSIDSRKRLQEIDKVF